MKFEIGQIVYALLRLKESKIIPLKVVEENISRTSSGEKVIYYVVSPGKQDSPIRLDDIDCETYIKLDDVKDVLLERSRQSIESVVGRVSEIVSVHFQGKERPGIKDADPAE